MEMYINCKQDVISHDEMRSLNISHGNATVVLYNITDISISQCCTYCHRSIQKVTYRRRAKFTTEANYSPYCTFVAHQAIQYSQTFYKNGQNLHFTFCTFSYIMCEHKFHILCTKFDISVLLYIGQCLWKLLSAMFRGCSVAVLVLESKQFVYHAYYKPITIFITTH